MSRLRLCYLPKPGVSKVPIAIPVAKRDKEFADSLSQWITLKKHSLQFPMLYNHWILGLDALPKQQRWSIIRNVLHGIERFDESSRLLNFQV
jgi:hypothetical protein